jgi:hypothetical protein
MSKTTKTTKTETVKTKADEMLAKTMQVRDEKLSGVRSTDLYKKILKSVEDEIESAASEGMDFAFIPLAEVKGELGCPSTTVGNLVTRCANPGLVIDTLTEDLTGQGYRIYGIFGVPTVVSWGKSEDK